MTQVSIAQLMTDSGVGFGTSGARGLVDNMTDRVCYAYTLAFLQYLQQAGIAGYNQHVAVAGDLRPSTPRIMAAVIEAARAMDVQPVYCGLIPSPAVALYGIANGFPAIMVTGSHIPDDRNGIKFNTAQGEITKQDEAGIRQQTVEIDDSLFDAHGQFLQAVELPYVDSEAQTQYLQRYLELFDADTLSGQRIGVYQHSGVGRDLLVELLEKLGAEVMPLGRSEVFVPVDTEAIREEDIRLAADWAGKHSLNAIVSTDGDADRPLVSDENGQWLRGDAVGALTARFLGAEHVVTPVSSNTAVDSSGWFSSVTRTRIGSPFVIAGMEECLIHGAHHVVGYEANGGFLSGDRLLYNQHTLSPLPTRDAFIVILSLLISARQQAVSLSQLNAQLPQRFTYSDRIKQIPTDKSQALIASLNSGDDSADASAINQFFDGAFGPVSSINRTDGLRISFENGDIIHLRPSGNAPELRCYSEADSVERAEQINRAAMQTVKSSLQG